MVMTLCSATVAIAAGSWVVAKLIRRHDLLHATSPFAFGRTMKRVAAQDAKPFLYSIHTDHAAFARIYSARIIRRRFGENLIGRMALGRFDAPDRAERAMRQRVRSMIAGSDVALISRDADKAYAQGGGQPPRALGRLRRGVDASRFNPAHRNAAKLKRAFGIPEEALILLFVGRIDETKGIDILVEAARRLLDIGLKIHILAVGGGGQEEAFRRAVGPHASLPGPLAQETLATIYASSDVFVFPSHTDVAGNAVLEAKASGLPCFVLKGDGGAQFIAQNGVDGVVVPNRAPEAWARVLRPVLEDGGLRAEMALAARRDVEKRPDWGIVFEEDLLIVWRALGRRAVLF